MLEPFERAAQEAWERMKTPLDRMYDRWVGEDAWLSHPSPVTFRIYDHTTGLPIRCHLCQSTEHWVIEGDEVRRIARVFVCEHEPIPAGRGLIRQISSVPVHAVDHCEETSRLVG